MYHLACLLYRYRNGLHQNLQPLPLLFLLKMMKTKVGSVSCQYTSTDKATIESNKQLIILNSLQMTSLLRKQKKRRWKQYKDRIPNQNDSRQNHCHHQSHQSLHVSTSTCTSIVRFQFLTGSLYKQLDLHLFPSLQDLFQVLQMLILKILLMLQTQ